MAIFDDYSKRKLGYIVTNHKITGVKVDKAFICLSLPHKLLLFDLKTLQYLTSVEDISLDSRQISSSLLKNRLSIAYVSNLNQNHIKIQKCKKN